MFGLRIRYMDLDLRLVREVDLPKLAALQPTDYEHDPRAEVWPGDSLAEHRRRLLFQDYWRSLGTMSASSWRLDFAVRHRDSLVGIQSLEAEQCLALRTVDTGSWLVPAVRGRGIGVAMRTAVLSLAFDHLGALAAVTSARTDNGASLGVSRRVGYQANGVSLNASGNGLVQLHQMRLTADEWHASERLEQAEVAGVDPCTKWFGLT